LKSFINEVPTGVKKMSVAFPRSRIDIPDSSPDEISQRSEQREAGDSHNASCAWSFCNGQDRELSSSPDEAFKLINLREVNIKYGSQPIDSDSDTGEAAQSCEISDRATRIVASVCATVTGLAMVAGCILLAPGTCESPSGHSSDDLACSTSVVLGSVITSGLGLTLSAVGVKNLVEAYKAGYNT
jgi:hypothetical protein